MHARAGSCRIACIIHPHQQGQLNKNKNTRANTRYQNKKKRKGAEENKKGISGRTNERNTTKNTRGTPPKTGGRPRKDLPAARPKKDLLAATTNQTHKEDQEKILEELIILFQR
jgi:hypothetical protein